MTLVIHGAVGPALTWYIASIHIQTLPPSRLPGAIMMRTTLFPLRDTRNTLTGGATAMEKICELHDQRSTPTTIEENELVWLFLLASCRTAFRVCFKGVNEELLLAGNKTR